MVNNLVAAGNISRFSKKQKRNVFIYLCVTYCCIFFCFLLHTSATNFSDSKPGIINYIMQILRKFYFEIKTVWLPLVAGPWFLNIAGHGVA